MNLNLNIKLKVKTITKTASLFCLIGLAGALTGCGSKDNTLPPTP